MDIPYKARISRLAAIAALGIAASAQSASAACEGQVYYRLWQPGGQETWYDAGQRIDIPSGAEGHIYVHVRGRGDNKYTTSARIGYPGEFGLGGDAHAVERSVKMQAQNNEDRSNGRIRFRADQPGQVQLGYEINGVTPPGNLSSVPGNCRTGPIPINVGGGGGRNNDSRGNDWDRDGRGNDRGGRGGNDGRGGGRGDDRGGWDNDRGGRGGNDGRGGRGGRGGNDGRGGRGGRDGSWQSASNLVGLLYEGILRRDEAGQIDDGYVRLVQYEGLGGLFKVAGSMFKSQEFQQQSLKRIENEQGRMRDRDERVNALLWGIYGWLYGDSEPSEFRANGDYNLLDACFRGNNRSCESLGSSIVENPLFQEANADDLDAVY